ncbi:transcriptional regulator [Providencia rettgeri]|uniref:winged helix-turn-helix domain-containing protein n=1 Tax=Providencia sp. PROV182 TaxID=2949885 RepID=UPI00234A1D8C|nr:winged helix-turn-helix domain-containing protein [Providencia sp. PROV182]
MNESHDYTIDEKYIFEKNTSLIYSKDDKNQFIELSKPAARLFDEIISLNLKKGLATRDELLTNVWEEYGLVGSNNNLNTYISEIRKKLEQVGIDPKCIVTVPKKGFRLDSHIVIHVKFDEQNNEVNPLHISKYGYIENSELSQKLPDNTVSENLSLDENTNNSELLTGEDDSSNINTTLAIKNKNKKILNKKTLKILLLAISTIAICYLINLFFWYYMAKENPTSDYLSVSSREKCIIQAPVNMLAKVSSDNINLIHSKLDKYNIRCDEPKRIILLSDLNQAYSIDKNISLSICSSINIKHDCISINDQRI